MPASALRLHVVTNDPYPAVWLNHADDENFVGICLGAGGTLAEALTNAVATLEDLTEQLQGPPSLDIYRPAGR